MNKKTSTSSPRLLTLLLSLLAIPLLAQPSAFRPSAQLSQLTQASDGYMPTIYGIVMNSTGWPSSAPQYGVYSFLPNQSLILTTPEHLDGWLRANSGGVWFGGKLHYMNSLQGAGDNVLNLYHRWDTETWEQEVSYGMQPSESVKLASDLTYDPVTQQVFGFFFTADGAHYELGTMEFTEDAPVKHSLKQAPIDMVAIAASPEGEVFGIGVNGVVYKFDKLTGDATVVGNTGVTPSAYRQSATFDFRSGKLYWAAMLSADTSVLYEVNPANGHATQLGRFANAEEITALYIPFGLADDQAPAPAENLSVNFPEGTLAGTMLFSVPTETYNLTALEGSVNYDISVDSVLLKSGTSTAGAQVTEQLTLEEGLHVFTVVLGNEHGQSPKAKMSAYIGHDTPVAPENLTLSVDNDALKAHLKWDFTSRGVNNGYIDPDDVTFTIIRYPGAVIVDENYDGNAIADQLPDLPGLNSYYYTVQAFYKGKASALSTTPTVNVGEAKEIPWVEDFSSRNTFSQFTVIDVAGDGWTWKYNAAGGGCADMNNNDLYNSNDDDDWLITPPLKLQGDRIYDLEFHASSNWAWDRAGQELLEVGFGENATAQDYEWVVERRIIQQAEENIPVKVTAKLRPKHDGNYFVGFHAVTPLANAFHLYIHDIKVQESSLLTSPDSVTNLTLEPAAKGVLRATVKFNAPTRDLAGDELTTLTEIRVYRDGETRELLASLNAPEPGAEMSYTDTKCINGVNTYVVVPLAGENEGQASRISGWVGIDYPQPPQNIRAELTEGGIRVTWDAPSQVGIYGGYVDTEDLYYQVYDKAGNFLAEVDDREYTATNVTLTGNQATNQFYVLPFSELGAGNPGVTNVIVTGDPYELPLHESFENGISHYLWWMLQDNSYYGFRMTRQESSDDDGGALYMPGSEYIDQLWGQVGSGKISLKGANNPIWSFSYLPYVGRDVVLTATVQTSDYEEHQVQTIDYKNLTGANEWRNVAIDLSPFKDSEWVVVLIGATIRGYTPAVIDNINVKDFAAHNLAASIYAPATMRIGMPKDVKVTVSNIGTQSPTDYRVQLYVDGQLFAEQQGVAIASLDSTVFTFPYTAAVTAPAELHFQGVVDLATDADPANNTTALAATGILQPKLPGVRGLTGTADNGNLTLSWQAPDVEGYRRVTEDFEDYSSWLTQGFGQWQVIDQDNGRTYDMSGSIYPHQSMQTAFMIFNNGETGGTRYDNMNAHSGEQLAASFDAIPSYTTLRRTADWLISPELSGEAQTVNLFARSVSETYMDKLEVAYTTGNATTRTAYTNVLEVDPVPNGWTEYSVELPAGAKYFAIKNTSTDKMALIVDDVTYEPLPLVLTGYDVYQDGERITNTDAADTSITLSGSLDAHSYQVVAVYATGQSALSEVLGTSGIGAPIVTFDLTQADVTVFTLDGIQVAQGRGAFHSLRPGVYVVRPAGSRQAWRVVKK
ncbi:MAG: choice-of-anchor J domain-containing protein [Prevotella sp.]|nr:choice-of-anchor J domain-containing protein [Prevotella sp.]